MGSLSEVAVTCLGVFNGSLYAGTYPSGLIFSTSDGLNWEEATATGQNFIQCFKEFKGSLYAGTSSPKGVKIYRTDNGEDWVGVYESSRELNIYCLEVFEDSLYAGTGSSGRVLRTQDGQAGKPPTRGIRKGSGVSPFTTTTSLAAPRTGARYYAPPSTWPVSRSFPN